MATQYGSFRGGLPPKQTPSAQMNFAIYLIKRSVFFVSRFITQVAKSLRFPLAEKRKTAALAALPIYY
jgi:hypothetical protein